ncbi:MAG: mechanosensitive ion channel [Bacteroidales bacterium]|nr:mechanosensitive ion channel [Bacteroidales bacterium]MCF8402631.1 mechanosensitive ion channel [Bacteroidales bacterium]
MTFKDLLNYKILETDNLSLTFYQIVVFVLILFFTWLILKIIKRIINRRLIKTGRDVGSRYAVFQLLKYIIWVVIIGVALETIGIRFNILIASSAALLVGLGLGLQQIFNDYVSGILILFEGNLKVNDVVQMEDNIIGQVKEIKLRTSKIETRDDFIIIVPNHKLVSDNIINWSHIKYQTRFNINVGVAYGSDTKLVEQVLLSCADHNPNISTEPKPFVRFIDFGNSSLDFQLFFWSEKTFRVENIKSVLRFKIDQEFRKNNIRIPFPQRDVHIKQ